MVDYRWLWIVAIIISGPLFASDKQAPIKEAIQTGRYVDAEMLLRQQISEKPSDSDAHFQLAKVLSWQKKFTEAEFEYRALLAREPVNSDYLLGLSQVLVWRGDARAALSTLEQTQSLVPGDPDVWRLHIQALMALNEQASRQKAQRLQQQAAERFPELNWNLITPDSQSTPTPAPIIALERRFDLENHNQIELGAAYDHLSKDKGYWRTEYLNFEHRFAPRTLLYSTLMQTERFDLDDIQFLLGGYYPLSSGLTFNLEGNISPSANVLAKNSVMTSLQGGLGRGWFLTGGYRHSEYGTGPLEQGFATLENYFANFRLAYTVRVTSSFDETQFGHRFDFSYYYQDISFVTLTYNMGGETGGYQGIVYDTQFVGLHGRHWFNQDWALTWELGFIEQGDAYSREGGALGIRRAF